MLPEELAREKIDRQLMDAGWNIVSREEYVPKNASAVKEALMRGNAESDYLLFVDDKAIAVVEAKREENPLGSDVQLQAERYAENPQNWYGMWFPGQIPLVYLANGKRICFKNRLAPDSDYVELSEMHSPKKMLQLISMPSEYGALPRIEEQGLRKCQYQAEMEFEKSIKDGNKKNLAILATGSGKTYLACLASYRLLQYTQIGRILFLADRNNLARQAESEFKRFDRTENQQQMDSLYRIERLKKESSIKADIVISTIQKLFAVLSGQAVTEQDEDAEDERNAMEEESGGTIVLGDKVSVPSGHFQFIIVDECHRSIYGKWRAVLDYFSEAIVLGLTATPTPGATSFFNNNRIAQYTYDESVVAGVNVPFRVYRISTEVTEHGGTIRSGTRVTETARRTGIENFEKYLNDNRDNVEALRIIYHSEDAVITHTMLCELRDRLLAESRQYGIGQIWKQYKALDAEGNVDELDTKSNFNALTNLIQIVRYAYKKNPRLTSLINGYAKRFSLYCGQRQRVLTPAQVEIMHQIAEFVIRDGALSVQELNEIDTDLWRKGVTGFGKEMLASEMQALSKFLLKVA